MTKPDLSDPYVRVGNDFDVTVHALSFAAVSCVHHMLRIHP